MVDMVDVDMVDMVDMDMVDMVMVDMDMVDMDMDIEEEEAQPGVARGRGTLSGPAWGRQLRGVRGGLPGGARTRGAGVRGGQLGGARVRGGQVGRARVRGAVPRGIRVRGRGAGGSGGWSSTSMFLGNIQVNDVGEAS